MSVTDVITLALYALAAARTTQLIMSDEILRGPRNWWMRHAPAGSLRAYWMTCAWCVSIAGSAWPAAAYVFAPHHPAALVAAAGLAFSWTTVVLRDAQRLLSGKANLYNPPVTDSEQQEATR